MKRLSALIAGMLFGCGLAASGMTNTQKVLGFLDLGGNWDPDLLCVMAAAVLTTLICFPLLLKRQHPFFAVAFELPKNKRIDITLIAGAGIFGIGWGIYGYCPGPALAALVYLQTDTVIFVVAMIIGMACVHFGQRLLTKN